MKATPKVGCPPVDGCKSKTKGPRDHDGLALPDHIPQIITNSGYFFFWLNPTIWASEMRIIYRFCRYGAALTIHTILWRSINNSITFLSVLQMIEHQLSIKMVILFSMFKMRSKVNFWPNFEMPIEKFLTLKPLKKKGWTIFGQPLVCNIFLIVILSKNC